MKKRWLFRLSLAVIMAFLASCVAPTAAPTQPPAATPIPAATDTQPAAAGVTKITFWSHDFPPREQLDRKYMEKFKQDNPGVDIEYVLGPGDDVQYLTKLTTAMTGGQGPDCFNLLNFSAGKLLEQNALAPLDLNAIGYANLDDVKKVYVEGTLDGLTKDGKLYALPSEVSNYSMFVNKKMFTDAGLDVDKDMPKTWEDMIPLAHKLNKVENGKLIFRMFDFTYGQADDATSPVLSLAGMAYQLGGTVLNDAGTESLVNTDPWIKSLQYEQDFVLKEKLGDPALTVAFNGFADGSVGMFLSGSWYGPYLKDQKSPVVDQYVVKPMPRWKDAKNNTGSFLYAYGEFVNASSSPQKQLLCMKLIKELASHPDDYLENAGILQPTNALVQSDTFKNIPFLNVFVEDMKGTPTWPTNAKSFEIADALTRAIQRAVMDKNPVKDSLDKAKQEIDALLAKP